MALLSGKYLYYYLGSCNLGRLMARPFSSQLGCYLYVCTTITIKRNQIWFNKEKEKGPQK